MTSSIKKNTLIILIIPAFLAVFTIIGQLVGGALYFTLTSIPLGHLKIGSLYYGWVGYNTNEYIMPYLKSGVVVSIVIAAMPCIMALIVFFKSNTKEEIHGSARLANDSDLQKSGLFPTNRTSPSILLGKMDSGRFKNKFVELQGQTFVGVSAPTGSGKGVGIVIPNLVNYSESIVNLDIKLENFVKSAGYRQSKGQEVYLFAPDGYAENQQEREQGTLRSHRWNPFAYIRRNSAYRIGDILTITASLYSSASDKDVMWSQLAGKMFLGLTLWMLDTEDKTSITPTFPYLLKIVGVDDGLVNWIKRELKNDYLSEECRQEFNAFISLPNETFGSIIANLVAPLSIFKNETTAKAVSGNDFDFRNLRKKGMSIYVGVSPGNKDKYKTLLNLFFEQLINENTQVLPEHDTSLTHQCLLLLDEFPALGRVNKIKESIGFTRQYNLRYLLIYQDKSQIEDRSLYGREGADNIIENLSVEVIYPPKKVSQRVKEISETIGTKTVKVTSTSTSRGRNSSKSKSATLQKRPVLMPHEIVEIGHEKHPEADIGIKTLLFKENQRSFIMNKIIYFEESEINKRVEYSKHHIPQIPLLG